jgi:hypothetical protein
MATCVSLKKYKHVSRKKKELEGLDDMLLLFGLYFVIYEDSLYIFIIYYPIL